MNISKLLPIAVGLALVASAVPAIAGGGPNFSAVVNSDGTLARGAKAVSSQQLSTGNYEVVFKKSVTACGYTAAVGLSGSSGTESPGAVNVIGRASNPKGIFVQTFDNAGTKTSRGFHVIVQCP